MAAIGTPQDSVCLIVEDQIELSIILEQAVRLVFPGLKVVVKNTVSASRRWIDSRLGQRGEPSLVFALIDLGLPDGSGIDILREISVKEPQSMNVAVTVFAEDSYLFSALAAGAFGYVLKGGGEDAILEAMKRLKTGEPPITPSVARRIIANFRSSQTSIERGVRLTTREVETLSLVARGYTVPEAASHLGLSAQTVAGYMKTIYQKLHVSNRAEATREAIRMGLV